MCCLCTDYLELIILRLKHDCLLRPLLSVVKCFSGNASGPHNKYQYQNKESDSVF